MKRHHICASSAGHVVSITSPLLSRKDLQRSLSVALTYIQELEALLDKASVARKEYKSLVGSRRVF